MLPVDALRPNTEGKQGFTEQARTGFRGDEERKKVCEDTDSTLDRILRGSIKRFRPGLTDHAGVEKREAIPMPAPW